MWPQASEQGTQGTGRVLQGSGALTTAAHGWAQATGDGTSLPSPPLRFDLLTYWRWPAVGPGPTIRVAEEPEGWVG